MKPDISRCVVCGTSIRQHNRKGRTQLYCSKVCQHRAQYAREHGKPAKYYETCTRCGAAKESRTRQRCADCDREQNRKSRERRRYSQYGLTAEEFAELMRRQDGACAICSTPIEWGTLHIDHDHACCPGDLACGRCVRGLLCAGCNRGVGQLGDDPSRLRAAANYIEKNRGNFLASA